MHPLVLYGLARQKMADIDREVDQDRLAAIARASRRDATGESAAQPRWFLRRLLSRLAPSGAAG
jgi:hypothetical protein